MIEKIPQSREEAILDCVDNFDTILGLNNWLKQLQTSPYEQKTKQILLNAIESHTKKIEYMMELYNLSMEEISVKHKEDLLNQSTFGNL